MIKFCSSLKLFCKFRCGRCSFKSSKFSMVHKFEMTEDAVDLSAFLLTAETVPDLWLLLVKWETAWICTYSLCNIYAKTYFW